MTIKIDNKCGHIHDDVGNRLRITYIPHKKRDQAKNWAGLADVIRINAYKGDPNVSKAMYRGAELPITDAKTFIALVSCLCAVYNAGQEKWGNVERT